MTCLQQVAKPVGQDPWIISFREIKNGVVRASLVSRLQK